MSKQCLQCLSNGEQCNAPAVNGTLFCRHHHPQREIDLEREWKLRQSQPFSIPPLQDRTCILAAVNAVLAALADRVIKRSEADTFIHGLKFAAKLMTEIDQGADSHVRDNRQNRPDREHALPDRSYKGDPATDRIVRELVAQSHEMARNQAKTR